LILVAALLLGATQAAVASGDEGGAGERKGFWTRVYETLFGPQTVSNNTFTRVVAMPIEGAASAILSLPGVSRMDQLVFGRDKYGGESPVGNTFSKQEWDKILMPMYKGMFLLGTIPALISIITIIGGFRMLKGSLNPGKMVALQESAWNTLTAIVFVCSGPFLLWFLLELNTGLVSAIEGLIAKVSGRPTVDAIYWTGQGLLGAIDSGSPLIDGIAKLIFAGITLQFNMLYLLRKWMLAIMLLLAPIAGWSWISKGTRTPMLLLLSEMASNALTPAAHALVFGFYAVMLKADAVGMFREWWAKLAALFFILPLGALVKRMITGWLDILGVKEEKVAGMAAGAIGSMVTIGTIITSMGAKRAASPYMRSIAQNSIRPGGPKDDGDGGPVPVGYPGMGGNANPLVRAGYTAGQALGSMLSKTSGASTTASTVSSAGGSEKWLSHARKAGEALGRLASGAASGKLASPAAVIGAGEPVVHVRGAAPDGMVVTEGPGAKKGSWVKVVGGVLGRGTLKGTYAAGTVVGIGMGLGSRASEVGEISEQVVYRSALAVYGGARVVCGGLAAARARAHVAKGGIDRAIKWNKAGQVEPSTA
jgi:hypothetical protein